MCYSAMVMQHYRDYIRRFGADVSLAAFARLYGFKQAGVNVKTPRGMNISFDAAQTPDEAEIKGFIDDIKRQQREKWEDELQTQRARLAKAEIDIAAKPTKKAEGDKRIATSKITALVERLADLERTELQSRDARIYPMYYAPVLIWEGGRRVVKPMRYHCRPAGKPAHYDTAYPGCYNARRDNLEGFWREQFGHTHAVLWVSRFYENVSRHRLEQRELAPGEKEQNVVVEFRPSEGREMFVACLWSRWTKPGEEDLLSFAAITDDPPPEVAAAGHDRCIIAIKEEHLDAWLQPGGDIAKSYAILDDREPLYFEHRAAA